MSEDAFDRVLDVNLKAAMFLAQAVARVQIAGGRGGRQVHVLSVRAQLGMRDRGYSAYCSSKGGLAQLVKQHAVELARHPTEAGRLTVISPLGDAMVLGASMATISRFRAGRGVRAGRGGLRQRRHGVP